MRFAKIDGCAGQARSSPHMTTAIVVACKRTTHSRRHPAQAGYPVRCGFSVESQVPWDTGSSAFADDDNCVCRIDQPATAGTGRAVTDLIFSIAKREVTFFSGTAPISFL